MWLRTILFLTVPPILGRTRGDLFPGYLHPPAQNGMGPVRSASVGGPSGRTLLRRTTQVGKPVLLYDNGCSKNKPRKLEPRGKDRTGCTPGWLEVLTD
ncbi:hypothetical protein BC939DRAFT_456547 [Gamsiella multidivaricata]|uniref:uncharacterized protein n=1 Tax=Gamsiella multidivaricata TaxID=101098 RepID=UPI00221EFD64|nr:uncharacterized protein BC939DRAFT_456547 [Gamsiella multidivaricata]KAI7820913.1 hypothetical protein BC939DRAFT_456547 [Gamsiella multidivaricata]